MTKIVYCTVNGVDCPYYKDKKCLIENPMENCDDFATFWDEGDEYWIEVEEEE